MNAIAYQPRDIRSGIFRRCALAGYLRNRGKLRRACACLSDIEAIERRHELSAAIRTDAAATHPHAVCCPNAFDEQREIPMQLRSPQRCGCTAHQHRFARASARDWTI